MSELAARLGGAAAGAATRVPGCGAALTVFTNGNLAPSRAASLLDELHAALGSPPPLVAAEYQACAVLPIGHAVHCCPEPIRDHGRLTSLTLTRTHSRSQST